MAIVQSIPYCIYVHPDVELDHTDIMIIYRFSNSHHIFIYVNMRIRSSAHMLIMLILKRIQLQYSIRCT